MKTPRFSSIALIAAGFAIPALAARLANTAAGVGYSALTHDDPPKNPANPQVAWKDAIVWTLASGALAGLAQLVARRLLAKTSVPAEGLDMKRRLRQIVG
jgi:hypothetical protein